MGEDKTTIDCLVVVRKQKKGKETEKMTGSWGSRRSDKMQASVYAFQFFRKSSLQHTGREEIGARRQLRRREDEGGEGSGRQRYSSGKLR